MFVSKTLLKLIDRSLLPAVIIVSSKLISLVWFARVFGLEYDFTGSSLIFSNKDVFTKVNSYSSVVVLGVVFLGLTWVIVRSHFLHETHISPRMTLRLVSADLIGLIGASFDVYQQMVVWLSYGWLATLFLVFEAYIGTVFTWIPLVAFIMVSNATWLAVVDVEREILNTKTARDNILVEL